MSRSVTIVTYHYVRDLEASRFPRLKARRTREFAAQVAALRRAFQPITMQDLLEALASPRTALPDRAVMLTFDDGYADHHTDVLPILVDAGIQGTFFVPAAPTWEGTVLPVNKIQFVLAAVSSEIDLLSAFFRELRSERELCALPSDHELWRQHGTPSRWDPAPVAFVKRMLQNILPVEVRTRIVNRLFASFVTVDERAFAEELYMGPDQVKALRKEGMQIGAHGVSHVWMDTLDEATQRAEVDGSRQFLHELGESSDEWTMCYPYGRWNDGLLRVLRESGCRAAFTVEPRVADLAEDRAMCLPRLDTNDLPLA